MTPEEFVGCLYVPQDSPNIDEVTDLIYNTICDKLEIGDLVWVDKVLEIADCEKMPTWAMRSTLVVTRFFDGVNILKNRVSFYERVYKKAVEIKGKEKADDVFGGLEHDMADFAKGLFG